MMKKKSLKFSLGMTLFFLVFVMGAVLIFFSYRAFYSTYMNFYSVKAQDLVRMSAALVDGDRIGDYVESGKKDSYYEQLSQQFNQIKENATDITCLYIFVPGKDSFVYVLEAYTKSDDREAIALLGDTFVYGENEYKYLVPDIQAKKPSTEIIFAAATQENAAAVSAWAPVFDSNGELAAMVEADYTLSHLESEINSYMLKVILFLIVSLLVILVIMLQVVRLYVTSPLTKLNHYVDSYEKSEFTQKALTFRQENEIKWLADSFCTMQERIQNYIENLTKVTTDKERMQAEVNVAKQIQMDMLPTTFPAFPDRNEFDIYAVVNPVKKGGSNFYDFFMVDSSHLAIVIGDVSGCGIPATIFAIITRTHIKNYAQLGYKPDRVLAETNNQLSYKNELRLTVSVFVGIIDVKTGQMEYVNAGQMEPLWKHSGEELKFLQAKSCFALGSMENVPYISQSVFLTQGDILFLHTQGVSDTVDAKGNRFTLEYVNESLERLLRQKYHLSDILDSLQQEQIQFADHMEQENDSTMVIFRYFGQ